MAVAALQGGEVILRWPRVISLTLASVFVPAGSCFWLGKTYQRVGSSLDSSPFGPQPPRCTLSRERQRSWSRARWRRWCWQPAATPCPWPSERSRGWLGTHGELNCLDCVSLHTAPLL